MWDVLRAAPLLVAALAPAAPPPGVALPGTTGAPGALVAQAIGPRAIAVGAALPPVAASSALAVPDPWIITSPVTISAPTDVGTVIVADGGSLTVAGLAIYLARAARRRDWPFARAGAP